MATRGNCDGCTSSLSWCSEYKNASNAQKWLALAALTMVNGGLCPLGGDIFRSLLTYRFVFPGSLTQVLSSKHIVSWSKIGEGKLDLNEMFAVRKYAAYYLQNMLFLYHLLTTRGIQLLLHRRAAGLVVETLVWIPFKHLNWFSSWLQYYV